MKSLLLAAAGAAAMVAPAASAQIHPGVPPAAAHGQAYGHAAHAGVSARPERCQLIYGGYYVIALAAPRGAASWDLDLRSPGLDASQGGPLPGASPDLMTLSQVVLLQDPTGRGVQFLRNRPVHAELVVRDDRGRTVCRDVIRTRGPAF